MSATRFARIAFSLVAWLFSVCAVIQVYLAGQAVFVTGTWDLHRNFGYLIGILAIVLLLLALAGRLPRLAIVGAALPLLLVIVQSILVAMRTSSPAVAALHPLNGFLIVAVGFWLAWRTLGYIRAPLPPEPQVIYQQAPTEPPPPAPEA